MNIHVSTAAQLEFADIFKRLERDFKMTKAAVARVLRVERSYVTMIIKGQRSPRIRTLEDMRELEKRQQAGSDLSDTTEGDEELNALIHKLKRLKETDRTKFEVAKQVVTVLAQTSA